MKITSSLFVLILLFLLSSASSALAYNDTYEVNVGETFTVYTTYKSNTYAILWTYDNSKLQPQTTIYSTTNSVIFKAIAPTNTPGTIIQATTYYYQDGTTSSGANKYVDDWKVIVRDNSTVSLNKSSITLDSGGYEYLTATASNSSYSGNYTWSSSNSNVASVSGSGNRVRVNAKNSGEAYITVKLDNGNSDQCYVYVRFVDVNSASVNPSTKTIDMDETVTLSLVVNPSNATVTSQSWKSKDSSIASVNQSTGAVTGVSEGETEIYCIVNGTITSSSCKVTVKKPSFTLVSTYPANSSTGQSVFTWPSFTFCRAIYESDAFTKITLKDPGGKTLDGAALISGSTIIFMQSEALETNTKYTMSFPANTVKDKYGTGNTAQSLTFTTGSPQVVTPKVYLLVIEFIDGTNVSFSLSKKPLLTFADHKLCVSVEGQMSEFELSDVENFHFVEETSGINTPKSDDDITIIWQGDDRVIISGADLSPKVCLYDIEGKYYPNRITVIGNLSEVSLSYLPKGIYLLKINNQRTLKIIRK